MAAKYIVFVLYLNSFIGCVLTTSKSTDPLLEHTVQTLQQTVESLVQTVQSQQHNISDMRQNMATADVLRLYLTQEVRFRDELELKMKELENNYTVLQDLYHKSKIEQEQQTQDMQILRNNITSLEELYNHCSAVQSEFRQNFTLVNSIKEKQSTIEQEVNQLSISLIDIETNGKEVNTSTENNKQTLSSVQRELTKIAAKQKDSDDVLRNSTEHMKKIIDNAKRDLLLNISSLKTSLSSFIRNGKYIVRNEYMCTCK